MAWGYQPPVVITARNRADAFKTVTIYLDPETFQAATPMGDYQGVTDQVRMSLTPGAYEPVLAARGASRAEWKA